MIELAATCIVIYCAWWAIRIAIAIGLDIISWLSEHTMW
jgi:hypothetical protein